MTKEREAAEQAAFDQGRHARAVAIPRDSDPHGKASKLQKHWLEGWDEEDGLRGSDADQAARVAKADAAREKAEAAEAEDVAKEAAKAASKPAKAKKKA